MLKGEAGLLFLPLFTRDYHACFVTKKYVKALTVNKEYNSIFEKEESKHLSVLIFLHEPRLASLQKHGGLDSVDRIFLDRSFV
jgi:hypothetical protein